EPVLEPARPSPQDAEPQRKTWTILGLHELGDPLLGDVGDLDHACSRELRAAPMLPASSHLVPKYLTIRLRSALRRRLASGPPAAWRSSTDSSDAPSENLNAREHSPPIERGAISTTAARRPSHLSSACSGPWSSPSARAARAAAPAISARAEATWRDGVT